MKMQMSDPATGSPMLPTQPDPPMPISFYQVLKSLRKSSPEGFRKLRDMLLERYDQMKKELGAANTIKLAIECDRHAIFAGMAASKEQDRGEEALWRNFQAYLRGEVPDYEKSGGRQVGVPVDEEDGQGEEQGEEETDAGSE